MSRLLWTFILWGLLGTAALAQSLTGFARAIPEKSAVQDLRGGGAELVLTLSQGVPFRVFTLTSPPRLVVDFSEVDFDGFSGRTLQGASNVIEALHAGPFQQGWSRVVAVMSGPHLPDAVGLTIDPETAEAQLKIALQPADAEAFLGKSGLPKDWIGAPEPTTIPPPAKGVFTVVLDPGHGGIDPGAERNGLVEKDLVLEFAKIVQETLRRDGVRTVLTRDSDMFVSLEARTARAHQAGAAVFVSLHADALSQGGAHGATVYTLSDEASDAASALLAERHNRADILAGLDLSGADDRVTSVLLDIARRETAPRSKELATAMIDGMAAAGGPMNRKPWRQAGFSVLKSADIPSVLVEIGFLSSDRDRKNLADPAWRAQMAQGVAQAILAWRDADAARAELLRQ